MFGLSDTVREVVSGDRRRLKDGRHNLDLTYVTPNVIGMGFPGSGVEGQYRNNISRVAEYFEEKHGHGVLVLNLSERQYDYKKFGDRVLEFGFPDHHSPPLGLLLEACQATHNWLAADKRNVVAVHCLAGKGRTGTVIASYLLFSGQCRTAEEALAVFQVTRTQTGVTMPSQRRYVKYVEEILPSWKVHRQIAAPKLLLHSIAVRTIPGFETETPFGSLHICRPAVQVLTAPGRGEPATVIFSSTQNEDATELQEYSSKRDSGMEFLVGQPCQGDVLFRCFHLPSQKDLKLLMRKGKKLMFRFGIHTRFVPPGGLLRLARSDVDSWEESGGCFDEKFCMELRFTELGAFPPDSLGGRGVNGARAAVGEQHHEGWLWKEGKVNTTPQRRWFVLRNQQLTYWKDPVDAEPKGRIAVSQVVSAQVLASEDSFGSFKFSLQTVDREYKLIADNPADRAGWVEVLQKPSPKDRSVPTR